LGSSWIRDSVSWMHDEDDYVMWPNNRATGQTGNIKSWRRLGIGLDSVKSNKKKCRGRKSGPETSHGTNAGLALVLVLELPALRLLWLQFMEKRMRRMDQG